MENIIEIDSHMAWGFLKNKHYLGRKPQITKSFGWYIDNILVAVCTFGKPASPPLCKGVCGIEYSKSIYELNRLCRIDSLDKPLSHFVSKCLNILKKENWIIISYSDTAMNHHGYIYQATNFLYTGATKARTDKYTVNGKHSRHYKEEEQHGFRKIRSPKHRYIYFCTNNRKLKKEWLEHLNYPILQYPKGNNTNYVLGTFLKDKIIEDKKNNK